MFSCWPYLPFVHNNLSSNAKMAPQDIDLGVKLYIWERPEDVKEVVYGVWIIVEAKALGETRFNKFSLSIAWYSCMLSPIKRTRIIRNVDEFIREITIPYMPSFLDFQLLPTDQILLAKEVKKEGKNLRPQWIEGLDGDLNCSIDELILEKIKTTEFSIVFVREKQLNGA